VWSLELWLDLLLVEAHSPCHGANGEYVG